MESLLTRVTEFQGNEEAVREMLKNVAKDFIPGEQRLKAWGLQENLVILYPLNGDGKINLRKIHLKDEEGYFGTKTHRIYRIKMVDVLDVFDIASNRTVLSVHKYIQNQNGRH